MFSKQNRGLWECAFCTPLYTLTGKEKTSDKTQLFACFPWGMKRLNSLHHSLGAWKTKNNPMSQGLWPSRFSWFSWFSCFFLCFFCFLVFFVFCSFFGFPTFPWDQFLPPDFVVSVSTCRHEGTLGQQENWILERDLSELKNQNCFVFFGWLGFKPIFNFLNSKA